MADDDVIDPIKDDKNSDPNAALIAEAVEKAVAGLKENNGALKAEKQQAKEQLDQLASLVESLGGVDALKGLGNADTVKQLAEMRKRFENDEAGKLLSEGKHDEWFDRRTASMRKDHENQIASVRAELTEAKTTGEKYLASLRKKILETEVVSAASGAGIEPTALLDIQLRAQNTFSFDEERNSLVLRDSDGGVVFGKDGKSPKTIREWLDDQKEVSRHWWPQSKGGGASGSERGGAAKDMSNLGMAEYSKVRKESGFKPY